jgi:lysophospholipase L1-like esterase
MGGVRRSVLIAVPAAIAGLALLSQFGLLGPFERPKSRLPSQSSLASGPLLIMASGTSLTANGQWTELLGQRLSSCRDAPVVIEKVARAGATSRWGEPALRARLARPPRPDLVLIEYSINDAVLARFMSLAESRRHVHAMVDASQSAGAIAVLVTMTPAKGLERLKRPFLPAYRSLYAPVAEQTGAGLMETLAAWDGMSRAQRTRLLPDGVHPTPAAMENLLVPALFAGLSPLLCRPAGERQ